jgi:hypothetical protein
MPFPEDIFSSFHFVFKPEPSSCCPSPARHQFCVTGSVEEIPEGMLCACKQTTAHWVTCEHCGARKLELLPVIEIQADTVASGGDGLVPSTTE